MAWSQQDSSIIKSDSVYANPEIYAAYPGGPMAWQRYFEKNAGESFSSATQGEGTVIVEFIVDVKGNVSDVKAISGPSRRYKKAENLIKKSGKWTPAVQDGRQVKSLRKLPVTFKD
jgi:protein TonB